MTRLRASAMRFAAPSAVVVPAEISA
jgi:hypothetical protein